MCGVQEAGDPRDIASQLDVTVDDFGVHVSVQHHRGPLTDHIISVPAEACVVGGISSAYPVGC
jgi:hypothetical protein